MKYAFPGISPDATKLPALFQAPGASYILIISASAARLPVMNKY
jgi:hypothetical protein